MKQRWGRLALAVGAMTISAAASAAGPNAAMLSNACAGCHGTRRQRRHEHAQPGRPVEDRHCRGHEEVQVRRASGNRNGTTGEGYSDAEIDMMGELLLQAEGAFHQPDRRRRQGRQGCQPAGSQLLAPEDGKEGKDDTPVMASQWLQYLHLQMELYESGKRKMPEKMAEGEGTVQG